MTLLGKLEPELSTLQTVEEINFHHIGVCQSTIFYFQIWV